jgi:hypothetical protein
MEAQKFVTILDKHINQEALLKELAVEYVMPMIEEKIAGLDIIPGTDLDKEMIAKAIVALKELVK